MELSFKGGKVPEVQLIDKMDKNDSIENHLVDAFDKWKEEHLPVKSHFDFRA